MPENDASLPDFTRWPSFPFEGDMRVKELAAPVAVEPPRSGEDASDCVACNTPDDAYIWENERWRVRAMDRPTGLPMVLILECRSHLDMGDLPNLLAAELGVMTVRLERAIRSLDGVARVHVNRWGDGSAHLHMWFLARPYGRLQLRGTFLSLWDDILPTIPEDQWRENLALVAAWLAEFGGHANAEPAHIKWQSPSTFTVAPLATGPGTEYASASSSTESTATPAEDGAAATPEESALLTDSPPARSVGSDSVNTGFATAIGDGPGSSTAHSRQFADSDPTTGSGSDHGTSSAEEDAEPVGATGTEPGTEAGQRAPGPKSAVALGGRTNDSDRLGELPHDEGRSASAGAADPDASRRPSNLGEAGRPKANAEREPDTAPSTRAASSASEAIDADTQDGDPVLHDADAKADAHVTGDVKNAGSNTSPDESASLPHEGTETSSATERSNRGSPGAAPMAGGQNAGGQNDASAEAASTRRA